MCDRLQALDELRMLIGQLCIMGFHLKLLLRYVEKFYDRVGYCEGKDGDMFAKYMKQFLELNFICSRICCSFDTH